MSKQTMHRELVILGSGPAGLTAAYELTHLGVPMIVFAVILALATATVSMGSITITMAAS